MTALVLGYTWAGTDAEYSADFRYYSVTPVDFLDGFVLVVPAGVTGVLLGLRRRWATVTGALALASTTLGSLAVGVAAWWGGFCFDPGETCQNTRISRALMLGGVLAAIGIAMLVQRFISHRLSAGSQAVLPRV